MAKKIKKVTIKRQSNSMDDDGIVISWKAVSVSSKETGIDHYEVEVCYSTNAIKEVKQDVRTSAAKDLQMTVNAPQYSETVWANVKAVCKKKGKDDKKSEWKCSWKKSNILNPSPWRQNQTAKDEKKANDDKLEEAERLKAQQRLEEERLAAAKRAQCDAPTLSSATYVATSNSIVVLFSNNATYSDKTRIRCYTNNTPQTGSFSSETLAKSITEYRMTNIQPGNTYGFYAEAHNGNSGAVEWSALSSFSGWVEAPPVAPTLKDPKSTSNSSVILSWTDGGLTGDHYDVAYSSVKSDVESYPATSSNVQHYEFDGTPVNGGNSCSISIDDGGKTWYFRVRRRAGSNLWSQWSNMKSAVVGRTPSAPTTYATKPYVEEDSVMLRWAYVNNDGSDQSSAEIVLTGGISQTISVSGSSQTYELDLSSVTSGTSISWKVRCKGAINEWGPYSAVKAFTVVSAPTLTMSDGSTGGVINSYPVEITATSDVPSMPVSYFAQISCNGDIETMQADGTTKVLREGYVVWSDQVVTTATSALFSISPVDAILVDGAEYTVSVTVANAYGLRTTEERTVTCTFADSTVAAFANAEFDEDMLCATIMPACYDLVMEDAYELTLDESYDSNKTYYTYDGSDYSEFEGSEFDSETDYYEKYDDYVVDEDGVPVLGDLSDRTLSVWRMDAYGNWDLIESGIENNAETAVVDPYPTLGTCVYRVCAVDNTTGDIDYEDSELNCDVNKIVIDIDGTWSQVPDLDEEIDGELPEPRFTSDRVMIPYNISTSEESDPDSVELELWGDDAPTLRNGTHLRIGGSWSCSLIKGVEDEAIGAVRRLMAHVGSVYVREPNGVGYWAKCKVTMSHQMQSSDVKVTIAVTRVKSPYKTEGKAV